MDKSIDGVIVESGGLYLVGGFLGYRVQRPRTSNGREFVNCDAGVLVDGEVVAVQFESRGAAGEAVGNAAVGDMIALRATNRVGVKDGRVWQFYTAHRAGSTLDAAEFLA